VLAAAADWFVLSAVGCFMLLRQGRDRQGAAAGRGRHTHAAPVAVLTTGGASV
jgi:hypothetical protein